MQETKIQEKLLPRVIITKLILVENKEDNKMLPAFLSRSCDLNVAKPNHAVEKKVLYAYTNFPKIEAIFR